MNKLMIALGVVALCGAVVAEESGVIAGANCVGYVTAEVAKGNYKTFAVTLTNVADPTGPVAVDKLFTISSIKAVKGWGGTMDQIWRWDTKVNSWAKYGYRGSSRDGIADAWRKYDAEKSGEDAWSELTDDDVVQPGETFLYFRGGAEIATITLAGQVKEMSTSSIVSIAKGNYQFIAYPWPVTFRLSQISTIADFSSIKAVKGWGGTMDQIWRWDTKVNSWAKYGYRGSSRDGIADAWRKYDAEKSGEEAWSELTDDDKIGAGEGFLYFRGSSEPLELTFKPLHPAE